LYPCVYACVCISVCRWCVVAKWNVLVFRMRVIKQDNYTILDMGLDPSMETDLSQKTSFAWLLLIELLLH